MTKRDETTSRTNALAAIELWYARRLYLGRAKFVKDRKRVAPDVPEEYVKPGGFIGPSTRTDGITAHGVETDRYKTSSEPAGQGSRLSIASRCEVQAMRENASIRSETQALMDFTMIRVQLLDPLVATAVELWAAGWKFSHIGTVLGVSKNLAHQYFERGVSQVEFALLTKPDRQAGMKLRAPRHMTGGDLFAR